MAKKIGVEALARILFCTVEACYEKCDHTYRVDMPNALAVIAISEENGMLNAPDMYMDKVAIGPGYPEGIIDLDRPVGEMLADLAKAEQKKAA